MNGLCGEVGQQQPTDTQLGRFCLQHGTLLEECAEQVRQREQVVGQQIWAIVENHCVEDLVKPGQLQCQSPFRRVLEHHPPPVAAQLGAIDLPPAEDATDPGVGVLHVGRRVARQCQHLVPAEDVVGFPVLRQVGVLDAANAHRLGDSSPGRVIQLGSVRLLGFVAIDNLPGPHHRLVDQ